MEEEAYEEAEEKEEEDEVQVQVNKLEEFLTKSFQSCHSLKMIETELWLIISTILLYFSLFYPSQLAVLQMQYFLQI